MLALPCRRSTTRLPPLVRASSSTLNAAPAGSASSDAPSSSSAPRSPRPRRRPNAPQIEVDYARPHLDFVAQPDPISNLRPILYKQTDTPPLPRNPSLPPRPQPAPKPLHHLPMSDASLSLADFRAGLLVEPATVFYRTDEFPHDGDESAMARKYRVVRETLDEYNQAFWASNNTRYHLGLNAELAKLRPADPPTHADDEARIECVDDWNARWIKQESARQRQWMKEWWGGQLGVLKAWWGMKREGAR